MADIASLFGSDKLSYDEFEERLLSSGMEFGDISEVRSEFSAELDGYKKKVSLERAVERSGAKNAELVKKMIDLASVEVDGEEVKGIDEQLSSLRESDPYLFDVAEPMAKKPVPIAMRHSARHIDPDSMTDAEYYTARLRK